MLQIAYFSTAAVPQDTNVIDDILMTAQANNAREGITGILVAGGNRYLQVIEGPALEVEILYDRIRADHRHLAVTTLVQRSIGARCFDGWTMAFRRDPDLGEFESFPQAVRHLTEQVSDARLREQIHRFARAFIAPPPGTGQHLWRLAS